MVTPEQQQFAIGELGARGARLVVGRRQRLRALVEPGHVHARQAVLLADAAIERLVLGCEWMLIRPGITSAVAAVDVPVGGAGVAAADMGDAVVGERDIDAAAIDVAAGAPRPRR